MKKRGAWRGVKALIHDGVDATVELVRDGNETGARLVTRVTDEVSAIREPVRQIDEVRRLATGAVLGTVKLVNRSVEIATDVAIDVALDPESSEFDPIPLRSDVAGSGAWWVDASLAVVNAAIGDHLDHSENVLDLAMELRTLDDTPVGSKVAVFVHGLGATEWSWFFKSEEYHGDPAESFATLLQKDRGYTPLFVRYNTGRDVAANGASLSEHLKRFVENHPDVQELVLFGHSMGGLVIRHACEVGEMSSEAWTSYVSKVFYLATPHHGAPLAKLSDALANVLSAVELPATKIIGRILDNRSAGIKNLTFGPMQQSVPLPDIPHYFFSATITEDAEHPVASMIGDILVRVPSASGGELIVEQFEIQTAHVGKLLHHELQNHPTVYEKILGSFD